MNAKTFIIFTFSTGQIEQNGHQDDLDNIIGLKISKM